jgi:hypothetical protein
MTDQEARVEYKQLAGLLHEHSMGWLIAQVEDHLRFGKAEQREIAVVDEDGRQQGLFGEPAQKRRRGPKATFLATVEYTEQERLQILAAATVEAVPHLTEMVTVVPRLLFSRDVETGARVVVVHESPAGEVEEKTIQADVSSEKLDRLRSLLRQLIKEAAE